MPKTGTTKRALQPAPSWPDLHHKHRRLAIPAVVAAVVAEKGCRLPAEQQHRGSPQGWENVSAKRGE